MRYWITYLTPAQAEVHSLAFQSSHAASECNFCDACTIYCIHSSLCFQSTSYKLVWSGNEKRRNTTRRPTWTSQPTTLIMEWVNKPATTSENNVWNYNLNALHYSPSPIYRVKYMKCNKTVLNYEAVFYV